MIAKVALLVLFGTTLSFGQLKANLIPRPFEITNIAIIPQSKGCPSGPELAPVICKFMQQNLDMYYKPNLIAPSTYIPSLILEKCDSPKLEMEIKLPAPIQEERPLVIPQPPELPPITIPKFPVPVITEEQQASTSKPMESSVISEMPVLNIPSVPDLHEPEPQIMDQHETELNEEASPEIDDDMFERSPMVIPQPPELPTYSMADFIVRVVEPESPTIVAPPCLEDKSIPEAPAPSQPAVPEIGNNMFQNQPESVPQPPELPAFVMPEFLAKEAQAAAPIYAEYPVHVEIPSAPELPHMNIPFAPIIIEQPAVPDFDYNLFQNEPMSVPQPPTLPSFVMPEFPVRVAQAPAPGIIEPLAPVPAAPELPPVSLPEFPVRIEIPLAPVSPPMEIPSPPKFIEQLIQEPCPTKVLAPEIDNNFIEFRPISLPQPPALPAFIPPVIAAPLLEDESIPQAPIPAYPEPLAPVPAAPQLPPVSLPEFPVRIEKPLAPVSPPMEIPSPPKFIEQLIQEPCLTKVLAPEIDNNFIEFRPISLPQPPALPAFIPPVIAAPLLEDESIPQAPIPAYAEPLAPVPAAPELPLASLPDFPVRIEIPSALVSPPMDIPSPPKFIEQPIQEPRLPEVVDPEINTNFIEFRPMSIPQPPGLPAFVMPELPEKFVEPKPSMVSEPYLDDQLMPVVTIPDHIQPLAPLPAAPQLSPATLPEFPVHIPISSGPEIPSQTAFIEQHAVPQPELMIAPQPPKLSELVIPELPKFEPQARPTFPAFIGEPCESSGKSIVDIAAFPNSYYERYFPSAVRESHKIIIPSQPINPGFFPTRCVYNLVMDHVIPNMAADRFRSMQNNQILPPTILPCS